jgi:hypothetical protein
MELPTLVLSLVMITVVFLSQLAVYTILNNLENREPWQNLKYTMLPSIVGFSMYIMSLVALRSLGVEVEVAYSIFFLSFLIINVILVLCDTMGAQTIAPLGNTCLYIIYLFVWGLQFEKFRMLYTATKTF